MEEKFIYNSEVHLLEIFNHGWTKIDERIDRLIENPSYGELFEITDLDKLTLVVLDETPECSQITISYNAPLEIVFMNVWNYVVQIVCDDPLVPTLRCVYSYSGIGHFIISKPGFIERNRIEVQETMIRPQVHHLNLYSIEETELQKYLWDIDDSQFSNAIKWQRFFTTELTELGTKNIESINSIIFARILRYGLVELEFLDEDYLQITEPSLIIRVDSINKLYGQLSEFAQEYNLWGITNGKLIVLPLNRESYDDITRNCFYPLGFYELKDYMVICPDGMRPRDKSDFRTIGDCDKIVWLKTYVNNYDLAHWIRYENPEQSERKGKPLRKDQIIRIINPT